ncbi:tRNA preQ1(34) S-adenosylmethionine ribosyltransferase-isomerase QueA [Candidatus Uhrbacteria bacterium]|nr:tRNA preQ1(34) S-adenosylmethionine ribosyltransferase-isomerase QueA [Candidatus Uhrbacteria bacterium]
MRLSDFSYTLPQNLIAQAPASPRDSSRLLVIKKKKSTFQHLRFRNIIQFFHKGDVLVMNDSKVIPARLFGVKDTGGKVEVLLIREISEFLWYAILKNFKEQEQGKTIVIEHSGLVIEPLKKGEDQVWLVRLNKKGAALRKALAIYGSTPTPPYIKKSSNLTTYQTVYAKNDGSVAAPTAGFHFTKTLLQKLRKKGVAICTVTLHVGPGTFLPIRAEKLESHKMHSEYASLSSRTASTINKAKREGRRVVAVGTTTVRTLESFASSDGRLMPDSKDIDLFIYPGYVFKIIDSLITNFHLPESTLLLLVCAFAEWKEKGGMKKMLRAYKTAVRKKYRFYSFGDSMIIL